MSVPWRSVPAPLRTLARWVAIVQVVGYTTSLVFVWHTTRLVPPGVAARYRGADPEAPQAAKQFPKAFAALPTITHTHLLSMAVILLPTGPRGGVCAHFSGPLDRRGICGPFVGLVVWFYSLVL